MEAGVGSKSADDDDGKVDVDKGDDEIECAGVLETPATLLPARAASQGEGGLGLTRGSILCEKERARGEALFFPNRALQGKKKNTRSLARSSDDFVVFFLTFFLSLKSLLSFSIYALRRRRGLSPQQLVFSDRKHSSKGKLQQL